MNSNWISPTADDANQVRIAVLEEVEDEVVTFIIYDIYRKGEKYQTNIIGEAFKHEENVPNKYLDIIMPVFRIVNDNNREFSVRSYDHFTGKINKEQHTLGVQFDEGLTAEHQNYIKEL